MSVYQVFPIIVISLLIIFSGLTTIASGQVNTNLTEESIENNVNGLQILSHKLFTDSRDYLHVVGEIKNNYPSTTTFVRIVGTFYDINNQVIGTQFTYSNPSDICPGEKAPFVLVLSSSSIPISQIDHYSLQASYQ
jgi:hypothetical protein